MMKLALCLLSGWIGLAAVTQAQEDPAHNELRKLRAELVEAIQRGDIDTVLKNVDPDVVVTWQNSEVCRGHKGLREFFEKTGKSSFKGYKVPPTPDDLTRLYGGDTGISNGETVADYELLGGHFELKSRWTATLVKKDGKWLLAAYQISMNVLDNPILTAAKKGIYLAGGIALAIGAVIGLILGKKRR